MYIEAGFFIQIVHNIVINIEVIFIISWFI